MQDLAGRLSHRVQLTSDGHNGVEDAFGADIDYAQLVKIYGADQSEEKRDSPAVCVGCEQKAIHRQARSEAYQHQLRGAPKLNHANVDEKIYKIDEWLQQEN
jgi:hypothetical protein